MADKGGEMRVDIKDAVRELEAENAGNKTAIAAIYSRISQLMKEESRNLLRAAKNRLRGRMSNSSSIEKTLKSSSTSTSFFVGMKRPTLGFIFNKGTRERRTRKGWRRGIVGGNDFFTDTVRNDLPVVQKRIIDTINSLKTNQSITN